VRASEVTPQPSWPRFKLAKAGKEVDENLSERAICNEVDVGEDPAHPTAEVFETGFCRLPIQF
jgi:hypothetical protein